MRRILIEGVAGVEWVEEDIHWAGAVGCWLER